MVLIAFPSSPRTPADLAKVLFKRKPVQYLPQPKADDSSEIWVIAVTNEIFMDYEAYLQRMDFYKQKRFICEITGHSGLSFFDALESEKTGSKEVDSAFPEPLREPVLRKVQFSTTSRLDVLVDQVFDEFRQDFYPGEEVTVVLDDNSRLTGNVREKAKFPEKRRSDGTIEAKAFSRYFVKLQGRPDEEALVDDEHIVRDRRAFTKQMLRSFIKNTTERELWTGAPWLVKHEIALHFRIDTTVPLHLQYGNKQAQRKAAAAAKKGGNNEGMFQVWHSNNRLPQLKPAPKGPRSHMSPEELHMLQQEQYEEYQRSLQGNNTFANQQMPYHYPQMLYGQPPVDLRYYQPPMNGHHYPPPQQLLPRQFPAPIPPPPPIKFPCEDLDVPPEHDGAHRPKLKYLSVNSPALPEVSTSQAIPGLKPATVGLLLETWNTLNVYCQVLQLDSFTFDDFVDATQFSSQEVDCELFVEVHCALLKKLVNGLNEQNGAVQISLPDLPQEDDDDDDDEEDESMQGSSRVQTPTPEPEIPAKRGTRSGLNKVEFAYKHEPASRSATVEVKIHRAAEMFLEYSWVQRLRQRDFEHGGWEMIMVGLLHQLAGRPRDRDTCEKILTHLAPLDAEATQETVRLQYSTLDINLRAQALQIICMLFMETKAVKIFLEENSNEMTRLRKIKIEHQRARKDAIAKLKVLNEERRQLQPEERSPTPIPEIVDAEAAEMDNMEDDPEVIDSEDDEPLTSRSLRRGNDRAAERKRKREAEQERKEKAAEAKQTKGSKEYQKCLKNIEKERERIEQSEDAIVEVDNDLREADCPRTRVLGKDRFWNRYYWFERNAMPYEGLTDSSTGDAGYANGRLWVQGPDDIEREGFIDVTEDEKNLYRYRFQLTPLGRKQLEEGPTSVFTAHQWGYYDDPLDIEMLMGWLDTRGNRELKLCKELRIQKDAITKYMKARKLYLEPREESEEPQTRMSTRTKSNVDTSEHRCLRWTNDTAVNENGHRHVEPPPKPKGRSKKVVADEGVSTRTTNRQGKPLTRQGTRYVF